MTTQQFPGYQRPTVVCRILSLKTVVERTGLSRSTIYDISSRKSKRYDATFPKRIQLSTNRVGWVEQEIDAWVANKIRLRDKTQVDHQDDINAIAS